MTRSGTVAAALALATMFAAPASAQGARVKAGTLVCNMSPSVGMVVGSRQDLRCRFSGQGRQETYVGSISRAGLDVGVRAGGRLVWAVYASTPKFARRALVGNYAGAAGDVAIGAGLGANVLWADRTARSPCSRCQWRAPPASIWRWVSPNWCCADLRFSPTPTSQVIKCAHAGQQERTARLADCSAAYANGTRQ